MPRIQSKFRQVDIKRAVAGAIGAGITITEVEVTKEGHVKIKTANSLQTINSPYDSWKAKRNESRS